MCGRMQFAPTIFTTMLSFLRGNANFFICVDTYATKGELDVTLLTSGIVGLRYR